MFLNEKDLQMSEQRQKDMRREADQERLARQSREATLERLASRKPPYRAQNAQIKQPLVGASLVTVLAQDVLDASGERQETMCADDGRTSAEQAYSLASSHQRVKPPEWLGAKPTIPQNRP